MHRIQAYTIDGIRFAPISKSHFQREVLLSLLTQDKSLLKGDFEDLPQDALISLQVAEAFGAYVKLTNTTCEIIPPSRTKRNEIVLDVGESGFLFRAILGVGFVFADRLVVHGSGTLLTRGTDFLIDDLTKHGCKVHSDSLAWPFIIEKPNVWPKYWEFNGSHTSQLISGFLMLFAVTEEAESFKINNPKSVPYIELTLKNLQNRGANIVDNSNFLFVKNHENCISGKEIEIQGDWSGASNLLVGAAINGKFQMNGLELNSCQADEQILSILKDYGAKIDFKNNCVFVQTNEHKSFNANIENCPDLFPILCVLAASAKGISRIHGTDRLYQKESNRLISTCSLLEVLGCEFELRPNEICIQGGIAPIFRQIESFSDHRIVMASHVSRLLTENDLEINEIDSVKKSYPSFLKNLYFSPSNH